MSASDEFAYRMQFVRRQQDDEYRARNGGSTGRGANDDSWYDPGDGYAGRVKRVVAAYKLLETKPPGGVRRLQSEIDSLLANLSNHDNPELIRSMNEIDSTVWTRERMQRIWDEASALNEPPQVQPISRDNLPPGAPASLKDRGFYGRVQRTVSAYRALESAPYEHVEGLRAQISSLLADVSKSDNPVLIECMNVLDDGSWTRARMCRIWKGVDVDESADDAALPELTDCDVLPLRDETEVLVGSAEDAVKARNQREAEARRTASENARIESVNEEARLQSELTLEIERMLNVALESLMRRDFADGELRAVGHQVSRRTLLGRTKIETVSQELATWRLLTVDETEDRRTIRGDDWVKCSERVIFLVSNATIASCELQWETSNPQMHYRRPEIGLLTNYSWRQLAIADKAKLLKALQAIAEGRRPRY